MIPNMLVLLGLFNMLIRNNLTSKPTCEFEGKHAVQSLSDNFGGPRSSENSTIEGHAVSHIPTRGVSNVALLAMRHL